MSTFSETDFLIKRGVTLFLDVGANIGQTGRLIRRQGYEGRIVSFEPIAECFAKLEAATKADPLWDAYHTALGAENGSVEIGVSENYVSSSIREATEELISIYEPIRYARHETIKVARLDSLFDNIASHGDKIHLKIDTQGFERDVVAGAEKVLPLIDTVRMEVAVSEVYRGEMLVPEAILKMRDLGYVLIETWPAWRHPETGEVLQFDLLFRRNVD